MSMLENLAAIKKNGIRAFVKIRAGTLDLYGLRWDCRCPPLSLLIVRERAGVKGGGRFCLKKKKTRGGL